MRLQKALADSSLDARLRSRREPKFAIQMVKWMCIQRISVMDAKMMLAA